MSRTSILSRRSLLASLVLMLGWIFLLQACGGGGGGSSSPPPGGGTTNYTLGGTVSGLAGTVILQNNGGDNLTVSANAGFTFATALVNGSTYSVSVLAQPSGQTCSVSTGSGTVSGGNITNVAVVCATNTYSVGGTVSGLTGTVVLQNNGGDNRTLSANSSFTFSAPVASGSPYSVTVLTQPAGQSCSVANGTGTVTANVTNVSITCASNTYTIGGSVSGLSGSVVLQNNGGDNLTVATNGGFTFSTALSNGATYAVRVLTQPAGQACVVGNGSGTVAGGNVANVTVSCVSPPRFAYVANLTSNDVSAYAINASTGALIPVNCGGGAGCNGANFLAGQGPNSVAVDPLGRFAYVSNGANVAGGNSVSAYTINATTGALTSIGAVSAGTLPKSVTVDPSGRFAYVGSDYPPSVLAYTINASTGALTSIGSFPAGSSNFITSISVDPTGNFLYAANFDNPSSNLVAFRINATTGALAHISTITASRAPRAVSIDLAGRFVYVTDLIDGGVSIYAINTTSGALTPVAGNPFVTGSGFFTHVVFEPARNFAYKANGGISAFALNTSGTLTPVAGSPFAVGSGTNSLAVGPAGRFIYATNASGTSNSVSVYSINATTGALTSIGTPVAAGTLPTSIAITGAR